MLGLFIAYLGTDHTPTSPTLHHHSSPHRIAALVPFDLVSFLSFACLPPAPVCLSLRHASHPRPFMHACKVQLSAGSESTSTHTTTHPDPTPPRNRTIISTKTKRTIPSNPTHTHSYPTTYTAPDFEFTDLIVLLQPAHHITLHHLTSHTSLAHLVSLPAHRDLYRPIASSPRAHVLSPLLIEIERCSLSQPIDPLTLPRFLLLVGVTYTFSSALSPSRIVSYSSLSSWVWGSLVMLGITTPVRT